MVNAIHQMLKRYSCHNEREYERALKEIVQEIALVGLWRAKFFEHAAFYGGTSLRILHGLDRFSEDLDFSLLKPDRNFNLSHYNDSLRYELQAFGFETEIARKEKSSETAVQSAFIKMNTVQEMIRIGISREKIPHLHPDSLLKIKFEIDTDPPSGAMTEVSYHYQPFPFSITTFSMPDNFAGKVHAALCRQWKNRVKGRDWYDLIWFVGNNIPLRVEYLRSRMRQSGALNAKALLAPSRIIELLQEKIETLDIDKAKEDVLPFIKNEAQIAVWSKDFLLATAQKISFI